MKEGPSESASRSRLQTTPSCCGKEPSVVKQGGALVSKSEVHLGPVGIRKAKTPEPLLKRRDPETCRQNQRLLDPLGSTRQTPGYRVGKVECVAKYLFLPSHQHPLGAVPFRNTHISRKLST